MDRILIYDHVSLGHRTPADAVHLTRGKFKHYSVISRLFDFRHIHAAASQGVSQLKKGLLYCRGCKIYSAGQRPSI
jgi:hypothetical protein